MTNVKFQVAKTVDAIKLGFEIIQKARKLVNRVNELADEAKVNQITECYGESHTPVIVTIGSHSSEILTISRTWITIPEGSERYVQIIEQFHKDLGAKPYLSLSKFERKLLKSFDSLKYTHKVQLCLENGDTTVQPIKKVKAEPVIATEKTLKSSE